MTKATHDHDEFKGLRNPKCKRISDRKVTYFQRKNRVNVTITQRSYSLSWTNCLVKMLTMKLSLRGIKICYLLMSLRVSPSAKLIILACHLMHMHWGPAVRWFRIFLWFCLISSHLCLLKQFYNLFLELVNPVQIMILLALNYCSWIEHQIVSRIASSLLLISLSRKDFFLRLRTLQPLNH